MVSIDNLKGAWDYQSFLVLPTAEQFSKPPKTPIPCEKWAMGQLIVPEDSKPEFRGELVFAPGVTLEVIGKIIPADGSVPASINAKGEGFEGSTEGAVYIINGWVVPTSPKTGESVTFRGSVLSIRGPNSDPTVELGGSPAGTVGAFILTARNE
ncbi:hypothetical protein [Synechococcus sp. PCC 7336]|uniref:hypothetical protein n=1 Tax=Synechococcus sp. PCC 7336 TaxID=195250 RepID=UPI0003497A28|nr:hypothetical protein [Synechococcus sp. PCC 7336]